MKTMLQQSFQDALRYVRKSVETIDESYDEGGFINISNVLDTHKVEFNSASSEEIQSFFNRAQRESPEYCFSNDYVLSCVLTHSHIAIRNAEEQLTCVALVSFYDSTKDPELVELGHSSDEDDQHLINNIDFIWCDPAHRNSSHASTCLLLAPLVMMFYGYRFCVNSKEKHFDTIAQTEVSQVSQMLEFATGLVDDYNRYSDNLIHWGKVKRILEPEFNIDLNEDNEEFLSFYDSVTAQITD